MSVIYIGVIVIAAAFAVYFSVRAFRSGGTGLPAKPEALLLEEAVVTQTIVPGMEGKAEVRKPGVPPLVLRVRATDPAQVFARGAMVRVIDIQDGCCFIEGADKEHLVR